MGKNKKTKEATVTQKNDKHQRKKPKQNDKPRQNEHFEQIPFRLREIMKSKERMKMGNMQKKKIKKNLAAKPQEGDIPVPHFRRKETESEKAFLRRVGRETNHVRFLTKNQVERQPEVELEKQEHEAGKRKSEKKKEHAQGRLQRLHQKKLERREDMEEKEMFEDHVQFGEVAMAPPSLSSKPRKAPTKTKGSSQGLLLTSLLGQTSVSGVKPSMARQRIMEEERVRVVAAYRHLKKQKQEQNALKAASVDKLLNPQ
ncbi:coiled-coil domain-containing protein 137 [Engraulis encrasicolus]|uniref:coiled-coil domain-containing protein 137 n=1 Tax=Engraulis encrasicolus TaxID=184585 RepID=UPI002FD2A614